jgi:DNA invertase Pin-like site-specific DNA recombinase
MATEEKRVAIYARTTSADREGAKSLDAQVVGCTRLALSLGYPAGPECVYQEIWTGAHIDRPQLNNLRWMAASGEIDSLIVDSASRLSRNGKDLQALLREFDERGVKVHFVQGTSDVSIEGGFVRSVLEHLGRV